MSLQRFWRRGWWDDERARELEAYLTIETDDNIARGTSPLGGNGQATLTMGSLGVGLHSLTATYNGSGSFTTSTSPVADSNLLVISAPEYSCFFDERGGAARLDRPEQFRHHHAHDR